MGPRLHRAHERAEGDMRERDDLTRWVARLYEEPGMLRMGHNQRIEDLNLGLGWLYYALARLLHPRTAVVIGSYRGFVPAVIGRALDDNQEPGRVLFIDPSMVDDYWEDADAVAARFEALGLGNVEHFLMTTQDFVLTRAYRALDEVGLVFIDGYHSEEQVDFDYRAFEGHLAPRGLMLFHDSMLERPSPIYGPDRVYQTRVKTFLDRLRADPALRLFDLPFGTGLTLLAKGDAASLRPLLEGIERPLSRDP